MTGIAYLGAVATMVLGAAVAACGESPCGLGTVWQQGRCVLNVTVDGGTFIDGTPTRPDPPKRKEVFLSESLVAANFAAQFSDAHTAGASLCTEFARSNGRPGSYLAWLSTRDRGAIEHFAAVGMTGPWYRLDGQLVFRDLQSLMGVPRVSITITETGRQLFDQRPVWTGTGLGGSVKATAVNDHTTCEDWTSTAVPAGVVGWTGGYNTILKDFSRAIEQRWTDFFGSDCDQFARLYCFEQ